MLRFVACVAGGVMLMMLPAFVPPYFQSMVCRILIYAIFAMSYNLLLGYTGLLSFGHAAFFGVGGYTAGILAVRYGIESFWVVAPACILMTTFVAAMFGIVALRVSSLYFLLITFALGQLTFTVAEKWTSMTGGTDALTGIPRPALGLPWFTWNETYFYFFVLLAFILCSFALYRIVNSPFGQSLQGIRASERRMRALGYNTWVHKYIAYVVAAVFAGIAGMLYAHFNGLMPPVAVGVHTSGLVMFMVILGGAGTFLGPVIGAMGVILLESLISILTPERWPLILGAVFVITIMFLRQGINPYLLELLEKVRSRYGSAKG